MTISSIEVTEASSRIWHRLARTMQGRSVLLADQIVSSSSNFLVLLIAARLLPATDFSIYALFQLLATTAVGLQRTVVLGPSMSVQRHVGRATIPNGWAVATCAAAIVFFEPFYWVAGAHSGGHLAALLVVAASALVLVIAQDFFRYHLLGRGHPGLALMSDGLWLATTVVALGVLWLTSTASIVTVAIAWQAGAAAGLVLALLGTVASRGSKPAAVLSIAAVWKVGKWASIDSVLATFVMLTPIFIAAVALVSPLAGEYRVLQTTSSPLNLVNSTIVLNFGLAAWTLRDEVSIRGLDARVRRSYRLLIPLAGVIALLGPAVLVVAGRQLDPASLWASAAVGLSAMMGAWVSPKTAAAQALGYQKFGAAIRVVSVVATISISVGALSGHSWLARDPVGPAMLVSGLIALAGWEVAYRVAIGREIKSAQASTPQ